MVSDKRVSIHIDQNSYNQIIIGVDCRRVCTMYCRICRKITVPVYGLYLKMFKDINTGIDILGTKSLYVR